jgi:hypothetical protein
MTQHQPSEVEIAFYPYSEKVQPLKEELKIDNFIKPN